MFAITKIKKDENTEFQYGKNIIVNIIWKKDQNLYQENKISNLNWYPSWDGMWNQKQESLLVQ